MKTFIATLILCLLWAPDISAQKRKNKNKKDKQEVTQDIPEKLYSSMKYRNIGPFRGGRVTTVTGLQDDIFTYYMGATGGGVWKTTDGGTSWKNISDGYFNTTGIGDVTIAPSDPNIIYVGTGESPVRGVKTSHGDGMYKSVDAGKTWKHIGLEKTRHISDVYVHPKDPNKVYVGAQGNPWGPNEERGVYLTEDGGETWKKILHVNEDSGIVDMSVSADNPNFMMVTSWDFRRKPWVVKSGGPGSRVYKTTDGGQNWREIKAGLPELKGKMGVSISPANPNIVYMAIEAKDGKGGVYRSDNAGNSFRQVSDDAATYARAWYYMHIIADPNDEDELWVLNGAPLKSIDGGKTWQWKRGSHVDHHDLWINPDDSNIMVNGNDGGASVSYNGGQTWSTILNQPTGQFYRVITDNQYPYRIYSGQQDGSTIAIDSRTMDGGIGPTHITELRAGESATVAFDPENPRFLYTTYFASNLVEYDQEIDNVRMVRPYPERISGEQPKNLKLRANWNGPVFVSPHSPNTIYYGSQYMMKSTDRGVTWDIISEDLTRNNKEHQGKGGYPISNEQITAESYNNIFNIEESPIKEGVIWVGSDDGLVHISQDKGATWQNITPAGLKEAIINVVEPSPHDPATAYIAVAGYKMNDFTPQIYKTNDYGQTWKKIVKGLPGDTFARSVREDPDRRGLLYAGTETGMFVSFDDGENWQSLQLNLPEVPITDLRVTRKDLVVSTQGRALWILDNLTPLHQLSKEMTTAPFTMLKPNDVLTPRSTSYGANYTYGRNPSSGVKVNYIINESIGKDTAMSIEFIDADGDVLFAERTDKKPEECDKYIRKQLKKGKGVHTYSWRMRAGQFDCMKEFYQTNRDLTAYNVPPGNYKVRMTIGDQVHEQDFNIEIDPRLAESIPNAAAAYAERDEISKAVYAGATEMAKGVRDLRKVKRQLDFLMEEAKTDTLKNQGKILNDTMDAWIAHILQKDMTTWQSNYQFEARWLIKFKSFLGSISNGNIPVTQGMRDVSKDYLAEWHVLRDELARIKREDVPALNVLLKEEGLPVLYCPE